MNQLAGEKSPYLLQHADNPVDWFPWGEAAFAKARDEEKPIFLSIGYSTCHWCHVMAHESFENEETARFLNEHFVSVKVDREERPDVDKLYMTFVQATTGAGGWPLTVFLAPDLKPFFGGTYFPPREAYGRISFPELLRRLQTAWQTDRAKVLESGQSVLDALERYASLESRNASLSVDWREIEAHCFEHLQSTYDTQFGGFGDAPKFPRSVAHEFLHRYAFKNSSALKNNGSAAIELSQSTLVAMGNGGINDQLGGGFHRYAVDSQWIVPHFEKMLYDQAQLAIAYLEMFQISGQKYFADIARQTLEYVARDLTHPQGGFFAGEDADSLPEKSATKKTEGAFYIWTQAELEAVLGKENAVLCAEYFGVLPGGNAPQEGDPQGEFEGQNILLRCKVPEDEGTARLLQACREQLFAAREKRPRPHRDEKVIVAWNGLMISAFARAAAVLDEPGYLEMATRAAEFIWRELWDADTGLLRRHYKDGAAEVAGFAEDYAFLIRGLLDLYEAGFETDYLDWALQLNETLLEKFWDEQGGGLFSSVPDENILLRFKEDYDGAEPSPNSVAAENCARLAHLFEKEELRERAGAIYQAFASRLRDTAPAMPYLLAARILHEAPPLHIVIVGEKEAGDTKQLLQTAAQKFIPEKTVVLLGDEPARKYFARHLPFTGEMKMLEGKATAYLCRNFACQQPTNDAEEFRAQLEGM